MKVKLVMFFLILSIFTVCFGQAQDGSFGVSVGLATPTGDFGDDEGNDAGLAKPGFLINGDFGMSISSNNLEWLISAGLVVNPVDEKELETTGIDVDAGSWITIPLMTGLRVTTEANNGMQFFGVGQIGLALVKGATIEITSTANSANRAKIEAETGNAFGFAIGGGIVLNRIRVALQYMGFGDADFDVNTETTLNGQTTKSSSEGEMAVSLLNVTVGITL